MFLMSIAGNIRIHCREILFNPTSKEFLTERNSKIQEMNYCKDLVVKENPKKMEVVNFIEILLELLIG